MQFRYMENALVMWLFSLHANHISIQGKDMLNLGHFKDNDIKMSYNYI